MTSRSGGDTKYGDWIPDDHWEDDDQEPDQPRRTTVQNHEIDVYYDTEPDPEDNYDRTKYTVTIRHDEADEPYVLRVVEHRWKGNYWRDTTDLDWRDTPRLVRERVASVLDVDRPRELDCGTRMVDEGGESRFEKYHKPRIDATTGDEMWASSLVGDALSKAEAAAERLHDDHEHAERAEEIVDEIVELKADLQPEPEDGDPDA